MTDETTQPPNPGGQRSIWLRGLFMLILIVLVNLAQTILGVCALIQFIWMLAKDERNAQIAAFGQGVANWLSITARFVTGASEDLPFPWTDWDSRQPPRNPPTA